MTINSQIKEALKEVGVSMDDALPYLISVYYGYKPTYIPDVVKSKINRAGIVIRTHKGEDKIHWQIPLFEEQDTNFDWVKEWVELFSAVNSDRRGNVNTAKARMKKFFAKYPQYRKDDVMNATAMYINSINDPRYITTSHYFIYKGTGGNKTEPLLEWCEKLEIADKSKARRSNSNTMI